MPADAPAAALLIALPEPPFLPAGLHWRAAALPAAWQARSLAEQRGQQYVAGRSLAAAALAAGSMECGPLPRRDNGAPQWPAGWVGSIAHCAGHAVAVVARGEVVSALGVDVEPYAALPADAAAPLLSPHERAALQQHWPQQGADGALAEGRRVLGAKECIHKALNPLNGAWLEFDEVSVRPLSDTRWQAEPLSAAARAAFPYPLLEGLWWRADGALWSLLAIRSSLSPHSSPATAGFASALPRGRSGV